jgi:hypothetical protein
LCACVVRINVVRNAWKINHPGNALRFPTDQQGHR